jgi:hypothetical protein
MTLHGQTVDVPDLPDLPTPDMLQDMQEAYLEFVEWDNVAIARGAEDEQDYWVYAALNLLDHPDILRPDPSKPVLLPSRDTVQTYVGA